MCCFFQSCVFFAIMSLFLSLDVLGVETEADSQWNGSVLKALDGFLMVLSVDGDMVYLSENVTKCLGLPQVSQAREK